MGLERANINFSFAKPAIDDAIKNISGGRTYNFVPSANLTENQLLQIVAIWLEVVKYNLIWM